jgi:RNA-directed DNA polymerase
METKKYADIKWNICNEKIIKLQKKIIVAWESKDMKKVYKLQETLINTFEARALAVRKVTSNKGSKTPGVDNTVITTDIEKMNLINKIGKLWNYQAKPVKRIIIPKANGKLRPLGIPSIFDSAVQALYLMALEPIAETTGDERSYGFRKYKSTQDVLAY